MQNQFDGAVLNEGKTKVIGKLKSEPDKVMIVSKDDITAGDGAKHDVMAGKAAVATQTACNNFRMLAACGISTSVQLASPWIHPRRRQELSREE